MMTRRQSDLLRFIRGFQEAHAGVSPSFAEMGEACNYASHSNISRLLDGLEERGQLRRIPNRARAIELLTDIPIPRGFDGQPLYFVGAPG